jgi:hypothetical protein
MAVHPSTFPDGVAYPTIPGGTNVVNVATSSALTSAISSATAGTRIVLANGTYSGAISISGKSGNSSAGISIEAANQGGAVFSSGATINVNNSAYVTLKGLSFPYELGSGNLVQFRGTSHHCRVTRCLFGPTSVGSPGSNKSPFIYMGDNVEYIRIDHCELRNKANPGNSILGDGNFDTLQPVRHIRIDHNLIQHIEPEVDNEKEPIRLGVSTMSKKFSNSVIERNVFFDCICEPEVVSTKACGVRVTGNTVLRSIGGLVIRHGTNSIMSDNYIVDRQDTFGTTIGSGGFRFYDADHVVSYNYIEGVYGGNFQGPLLLDTGDAEGSSTNLSGHWRVVGAKVERNVLFDNPEGIRIGDNYSSVPRDCTIRDNLVVKADTGAAITQKVAPSNTVLTNNQYYASGAAAGMTQGSDTIWRKPGYGPRVTYLTAIDVGPAADLNDTDGTGVELGGGGPGTDPGPGPVAVPADVLDIGPEDDQNHFSLQYAVDGSATTSSATMAQVAAGFAAVPYFAVTSGQTLGVGGIPAPAAGPGVVLRTTDLADTWVLSTPNTIYDGGGHTVEKIEITADGVTVQNTYVRGAGNAGIYLQADNCTIQNCDIAQVNEGGEGDINGITFFGNGTKILYNVIGKSDFLVDGELNGSHTDGIQTWATPGKDSSSNVEIRGNWISGPAQSDERYLHQGVQAEGPDSEDGGGGGTGTSTNWIVTDNYFKTYGNQCLHFDDIHDVVVARNTFDGSCTKIVEPGDFSTGIQFYSDNIITGSYGSKGVSTISGSGPGGTTGSGTPAVQFRVRADSAHTSGSSFPRSELRETRADGTEMAFDAMVGNHTLHTRARITHLPAADPEVIVAQLHNGVTGDQISVRTQLVSGQTKLLVRINGTQANPRLDESYQVGDEFEIELRVLDGGLVEVYYEGSTSPLITGQLTPSGAGASWYWKVGAYAQFDATSAGSATEYVAVEHRDLRVTHSGVRVNAGTDATVVAGQTFSRLAQELGLTGVTSRRWTIVSQPAPPVEDPGDPTDPPPSSDLTQAAVRFNWGTPHPLSDEFDYTGTPDSTKWKLPGADWAGHNGNGRRRPERQTVTGGKLVMTGLANGDSGWMQHKLDREYGRFEVRCRSFATDTSNGNDYHPVLLIWPESNSRKSDGEYDYMENGTPGGNGAQAFMHFPGDGDEQRSFTKAGVDRSVMHNWAFEWTSAGLKGYIDGVEWFSTSGGASGDKRNIQAMGPGHACIQLDNFDGTDQTPATFEVEWFRLYDI